MARLQLSTFQYRYTKYVESNNNLQTATTRRQWLTVAEEKTIVGLIKYYSARGHPLNHTDIGDVVELIVKNMSQKRRSKIPFRNCRPGCKFINNFERHHRYEIKIAKASKQEAIRWKSTNAETLTTHFAEIEAILTTIASITHGLLISTSPGVLLIAKSMGECAAKPTTPGKELYKYLCAVHTSRMSIESR